jgi:glycosyltransferase involved in cell wall biosynthesis
MLAAKKSGIPIRIAHSHNTTCDHKVIDKLLRPLLYRTYTHGIGCGIEAGRWMFGNRPHVVLQNGINLRKFAFDQNKRNTLRNQLAIDDKTVVGHVGRFTDQKNHGFLLRIFKEYIKENANSVLLLVGDGPMENEVRNCAKELNVEKQVIFYGTTADTSALYSAMDIFVFPSKYEGVPLTLVEAQANGLPSVISDRISREVIRTDLVSVKNLELISEWVEEIKVLTCKLRRSELLSDKAIEDLSYAGFGIEGVIKQVDDLYSK